MLMAATDNPVRQSLFSCFRPERGKGVETLPFAQVSVVMAPLALIQACARRCSAGTGTPADL